MTQSLDELLDAPSLGTETDKAWPAGPPKPGLVYSFVFTDGQEMVAMLQSGWLSFGTDMERMRRAAEGLDKRVKELVAQNNTLIAEQADLKDRHKAITEQLRKHRIDQAERQIIVPDAAGNLRKLSEIKR